MSKVASTTFTGDTTLGPFVVGDQKGHDTIEELISYQLDGTWSGVTATFQLCNDPDVSPQTWTAMVNGAFTADSADVIRLPSGSQFQVVVSGSGSPLPSVYCAVRGQIKLA